MISMGGKSNGEVERLSNDASELFKRLAARPDVSETTETVS